MLRDALFGHYVLPVGDLNGDGLADVVVSAPNAVIDDRLHGIVSAWSPKSGQLIWRKIAKRSEIMGWHLAPAADHDADGVPDVFVGSPSEKGGRVYLISGRDGETLRTFLPPTPKSSFGWYLSDTDDFDDDDKRDLLVGNAWGPGPPGDPSSEVFLMSSATGRVLRQWKDEDTRHSFGEVVSYVGDLDGDGRGEVVIASPCTPRPRTELAGVVQVFSGVSGKELRRWEGKQVGELYGRMVSSAGDVNGDGVDDIAIGAPWFADGDRTRAGRVEIRSGASGDVLAEWLGEMRESWFGWHIRRAPDPGSGSRPSLLVGSLRQTVNGTVGTGVLDYVVLKSGGAAAASAECGGDAKCDSPKE